MVGELPAVLTCAVTIGLLGLAEFLRLWDGTNAQFWKGFNWATRCGLVVLLSFLIASLVGIGVYSRAYSTQEPLILLLGIYWALFLWRIRKCICQVLALACAGALQFVGIAISSFHWSNKDTAKWVASSGVIVFVLAFYCVEIGLALYRYKASIDWHIVVISILWLCVPAGTIVFCLIPDELWFYLAHCFFLCIELLAILVSRAWVTWRLAKETNSSSIFGDRGHASELATIQGTTTSDYGRQRQVATTFLLHMLIDDSQYTRDNSPPVTLVTGIPLAALEQDDVTIGRGACIIATRHNMPCMPPPTPT
ncbi:hypothetical protein GQ44DRAFT_779568 [Phaeosphaeriaceae sp. PMI808]|nr:hypothetical protein GQ44DRAFT_779568 [Phaeosphaeriaceae sp. PMI808]